ncbi:hypothetical protein LCGC14_0587840 [marine sediment metagenome]|uniref:Uncharacterized protein n=1 Tax=marine sediment metagenome TaxID=412755 RepID=A0A0F9U0M5_9ZZZZ
MASETDIRIARAVALKAAVEMASARQPPFEDVLSAAERYTGWLLDEPLDKSKSPTADRDPGPDVPYGEEPPHPGPSSGPPAPHLCGHGPNDTQGCGAEMNFFGGRNAKGKDYSGYRCPNQTQTTDPAEQAAENVRHPVRWMK